MGHRSAAVYFLVQGIAGAAWWLSLWLNPQWVALFWPESFGEPAFHALALPDLLIFTAGSIGAAILALRKNPRAALAAWLTAGGTLYATLYCWAAAALSGAAWLAVAAMTPAALASLVFAARLSRQESST